MDRARMFFEEGRAVGSDRRLDDAAAAAEEARIKYDMLAAALSGKPRLEALDKLSELNRLIKSIGDARSEARRVEPPKPIPAPPAPTPTKPAPSAPAPVKVSTPDEALKALAAFKDYVQEPSLAAVGPARSLAISARARSPEFSAMLEAASVFFDSQTSAEPFHSSMERKMAIDLLGKYPPSKFAALGPAELEQAAQDAGAAIRRLPQTEKGELLRLWGLAHLARLGTEAALDRRAAEFGLTSDTLGPTRVFGTPEGLALARVKLAENYDEVAAAADRLRTPERTPIGAAVFLLRLVKWTEVGAKEEQMAAVADLDKALKKVKPRDRDAALHKNLAKVLKDLQVCRHCKGSGLMDCPSCVNGQATFQCERCNGYGKILASGARPLDCTDCKTRGRWQDKCPKCSASGVKPCNRCDGKPWEAPRAKDLIGFAACGTCDGGGFVLSPFKIPCAECDGIGQRPYKP